MFQIGLTGAIAAGKSTVAALLAEHGAEVIDCDQLAREVVEFGTPGLAAVVARFGRSVLTDEGHLDRARLGRLVFADPTALADLEAILHPLIRRARDERLAASCRAVAVIEAIKLVEAGYHRQCDVLWVVTASREKRLRRLVAERGLTPEVAAERVAAQQTDHLLAVADLVLTNDGDLEALTAQVAAAWQRWVPRV